MAPQLNFFSHYPTNLKEIAPHHAKWVLSFGIYLEVSSLACSPQKDRHESRSLATTKIGRVVIKDLL